MDVSAGSPALRSSPRLEDMPKGPKPNQIQLNSTQTEKIIDYVLNRGLNFVETASKNEDYTQTSRQVCQKFEFVLSCLLLRYFISVHHSSSC